MALTDPIVSIAWLAERSGDPSVVVLDASWHMPGSGRDPSAEYGQGHVPGAVFFDIDAVSDRSNPLPHMLPEPPEFAIAARRLGVSSNSTVVVYDSVGLFSAPRAWWTFRVMGHKAVFVLDGGLPRWIAEDRPLETGWRAAEHGDFRSHFQPALVADLAAVSEAIGAGSRPIIDARPRARFTAEAPEPRAGLRSGHMPGAKNLPFADVVEDGSLASAAKLAEIFKAAGVDSAEPAITSCGSGISAAVLALALARLGQWETAVYDGSWTEWGGRADTAVVTGP